MSVPVFFMDFLIFFLSFSSIYSITYVFLHYCRRHLWNKCGLDFFFFFNTWKMWEKKCILLSSVLSCSRWFICISKCPENTENFFFESLNPFPSFIVRLLPDTWFSTHGNIFQSHFFTLPVTFHSPHPGSDFTTRQHIFSFNGFPVNFHFTLWHRIEFLTSHAEVCTPTLNNK